MRNILLICLLVTLVISCEEHSEEIKGPIVEKGCFISFFDMGKNMSKKYFYSSDGKIEKIVEMQPGRTDTLFYSFDSDGLSSYRDNLGFSSDTIQCEDGKLLKLVFKRSGSDYFNFSYEYDGEGWLIGEKMSSYQSSLGIWDFHDYKYYYDGGNVVKVEITMTGNPSYHQYYTIDYFYDDKKNYQSHLKGTYPNDPLYYSKNNMTSYKDSRDNSVTQMWKYNYNEYGYPVSVKGISSKLTYLCND